MKLKSKIYLYLMHWFYKGWTTRLKTGVHEPSNQRQHLLAHQQGFHTFKKLIKPNYFVNINNQKINLSKYSFKLIWRGENQKFTCSKHCWTAANTVQCPKAGASLTKWARLAIDLSSRARLRLWMQLLWSEIRCKSLLYFSPRVVSPQRMVKNTKKSSRVHPFFRQLL